MADIKAFTSMDKLYKDKGIDLGNQKHLCFYRTEFPTLDLMLGKDLYNKKENGEYEDKPYLEIRGFRTGMIFTTTGDPQTGKSTICSNIAGNITRPFNEGSDIYYLPVETNGMSWDRLQDLTGFSKERMDRTVKIEDTADCSTEYIHILVKTIAAEKESDKKKYTHEAISVLGEKVTTYKPTIIIIDSWSELVPDAVKDSEFTNMYHGQKTNRNGVMLERISKYLVKFNIMVFTVLHVTDKINTGYGVPKVVYKNISNTVKTVGGKKIMFATRVGLYFSKYEERNEDKLVTVLGPNSGIGHIVKAVLWKNSFGLVKVSAEYDMSMALHDTKGFDAMSGLIYDLEKKFGIIEHNGGGYKRVTLDNGDVIKFRMSDFLDTFINNAEFRQCINTKLRRHYNVFTDSRVSIEQQEKESKKESMMSLLML